VARVWLREEVVVRGLGMIASEGEGGKGEGEVQCVAVGIG